MNASIVPATVDDARPAARSRIDQFSRNILRRSLRRLRTGSITIVDGDERDVFGNASRASDLRATVTVTHPQFFRKVVFGGHLGAAEAWIDGLWTADDLTALIRLLIRNPLAEGELESRARWLLAPLARVAQSFRGNTRDGSRRNIAAHYDLGNAFFEHMLDETMTYSCALFERPDVTLAEASVAKLDRVIDKLAIGAGDHVLEIGTGWGAFAIRAARRMGCRVTTTTISREQFEFTRARVAEAGLENQITVLCSDYRDLTGTYDKLVSIEMIEAIGHRNFDSFFHRCAALLRNDGQMALQTITIEDRRFETHKRTVDFIKRYIFPGSCIPSVTALCNAATRASDLRLVHLEDITPHYAETLRRWRDNVDTHVEAIRALGYSDRFLRLWEFYLRYCEAGFEERYIGDVQMVFAKPDSRAPSILGELDPGLPEACEG